MSRRGWFRRPTRLIGLLVAFACLAAPVGLVRAQDQQTQESLDWMREVVRKTDADLGWYDVVYNWGVSPGEWSSSLDSFLDTVSSPGAYIGRWLVQDEVRLVLVILEPKPCPASSDLSCPCGTPSAWIRLGTTCGLDGAGVSSIVDKRDYDDGTRIVKMHEFSGLLGEWSIPSSDPDQPDIHLQEIRWTDGTYVYAAISFAENVYTAIVDYGEKLYDNAVHTSKLGQEANRDPELKRLYASPDKPDSADVVVITAEATDPDGDALFYRWEVDGEVQTRSSGSSVTWKNPPAGSHTVIVTVGDGRGGSAQDVLYLDVASHVGAGDRDQDGVPDDEDLCPDEPAPLTKDGCPEFAVTVKCEPASPTAGEPVSCKATPSGVHAGEQIQFHWSLDGTAAGGAQSAVWSWAAAEEGPHEVRVYVVGAGRDAEAALPLEVSVLPELTAGISVTPDPPVAGSDAFLTAVVRGQRSGDTLTYAWYADGVFLSEERTCTWQAITGTHIIDLVVHAEPGGREATPSLWVTAASAVVAMRDDADAGFAVSMSCGGDLTSDEVLTCAAWVEPQGLAALFQFRWWIDGAPALVETALDRSSLTLSQPAPGDHRVQILVRDTQTNRAQSASAAVSVRPGRNAAIPPLDQAGAAGGTLAALGAWLWWEYALRRREEAREAGEAAIEEAADERSRKEQAKELGEWSDEQRRGREEKARAEGYEYDPATGTRRRSPEYIDRVERDRQAFLDKCQRTADFINSLKKQLPPSEWPMIDHLLSEAYSPDHPSEAALDDLYRLKQAVFDKVVGQNEGQAAESEYDGEVSKAYATGASRMGTGAAIASTVLGVGAGVGLVAGWAGYSIPALTAIGDSYAQLAGFHLALGAAGGFAQGYSEDGIAQGLHQALTNTMPVNGAIQAFSSGEKGEGLVGRGLRVAGGLLQDAANVFNLAHGPGQISRALGGVSGEVHLPPAALRAAGAAERLGGAADDVAPVLRGTVKPATPAGRQAALDAAAARAGAAKRLAGDVDHVRSTFGGGSEPLAVGRPASQPTSWRASGAARRLSGRVDGAGRVPGDERPVSLREGASPVDDAMGKMRTPGAQVEEADRAAKEMMARRAAVEEGRIAGGGEPPAPSGVSRQVRGIGSETEPGLHGRSYSQVGEETMAGRRPGTAGPEGGGTAGNEAPSGPLKPGGPPAPSDVSRQVKGVGKESSTERPAGATTSEGGAGTAAVVESRQVVQKPKVSITANLGADDLSKMTRRELEELQGHLADRRDSLEQLSNHNRSVVDAWTQYRHTTPGASGHYEEVSEELGLDIFEAKGAIGKLKGLDAPSADQLKELGDAEEKLAQALAKNKEFQDSYRDQFHEFYGVKSDEELPNAISKHWDTFVRRWLGHSDIEDEHERYLAALKGTGAEADAAFRRGDAELKWAKEVDHQLVPWGSMAREELERVKDKISEVNDLIADRVKQSK